MRILLVEDDPLLGDALAAGLRQMGFGVDWLRDGSSADAALTGEACSAIVLDIGLPRLSGLELLKRLRSRGDDTPVLLLTAREALEERVAGLDAGADDYVVKPVAIAELAARLRAIIRRRGGHAGARVNVGELVIEPAAHRAYWRGAVVDLSPREFAVLLEFALHAGRVLSREQLESRLYQWDSALESNAIEVHVHHLRRKLAPEVIRTVRGVGYVMPASESAGAA